MTAGGQHTDTTIDDQLAWRISSFSGNNSSCVAVAPLPDGRIAVRNSNTPEQGVLVLTRALLQRLIAAAKAGDLDYLAD